MSEKLVFFVIQIPLLLTMQRYYISSNTCRLFSGWQQTAHWFVTSNDPYRLLADSNVYILQKWYRIVLYEQYCSFNRSMHRLKFV